MHALNKQNLIFLDKQVLLVEFEVVEVVLEDFYFLLEFDHNQIDFEVYLTHLLILQIYHPNLFHFILFHFIFSINCKIK